MIDVLWLLKLAIAPLLVGAVSLAVRVWGPSVGSLLMGLPWITGPVLFTLGLERGDGWVAGASIGVLLGTVALGGFTFAYALVGRTFSWPASLAAAALGFVLTGAIVSNLSVSAPLAAVLASLSLLGFRWLIAVRADAPMPGALPWWDIPARMLATLILVLVVNLLSQRLGPQLNGIVATYPVVLTVVGTFMHAQWGSGSTTALYRGALLSLQSFVAFFLVTALTAESLGLVGAYIAASCAALVVTSLVLTWYRRVRILARPAAR